MSSIPRRLPKPASLDLAKHRELLRAWLATVNPGLVAELARDELADITRLTEAINALAKRISERSAPWLRRCCLSRLWGVHRAKLVGEAAGVDQVQERGGFARHSGVAPIPVWSGNTAGRVRLTRSGNRQLNAALHRIAVTQIRLDGLGQAYYQKRLDAAPPEPRHCAVSNAAWPACYFTTCTQTTKSAIRLANRQRA